MKRGLLISGISLLLTLSATAQADTSRQKDARQYLLEQENNRTHTPNQVQKQPKSIQYQKDSSQLHQEPQQEKRRKCWLFRRKKKAD